MCLIQLELISFFYMYTYSPSFLFYLKSIFVDEQGVTGAYSLYNIGMTLLDENIPSKTSLNEIETLIRELCAEFWRALLITFILRKRYVFSFIF